MCVQGRVAQLVADHKGALGGFLADTAALMRTKKVPVLELNGRTKSLSAIYQKLDTPSSATGNSRVRFLAGVYSLYCLY